MAIGILHNVTVALILLDSRHLPRRPAALRSEAPIGPPPSHASNERVVCTRLSPGSSRSITSPRLTISHLHSSFDLIFNIVAKNWYSRKCFIYNMWLFAGFLLSQLSHCPRVFSRLLPGHPAAVHN